MNDDLHSFIEPELEARIVALVLGEVSAFEKEELERIMDERPEIGLWKRRIEAVHGLVGEAAQPASDKEWKLSSERRAKVFSVIRQGEAPEKTADEVKKIGISRAQRRAILSIAACVMISLLFLAGMKSTIGQKDAQPDLALYSEGIKAEEQSQAWYDSRVAHEASQGVSDLSLVPSEPQKGKGRSAAVELAAIDDVLGRDFYGLSGDNGKSEGSPDSLDFATHKKFRQIAERNERFRDPEEGRLHWAVPSIPEPPLPEAPTSSMAKVVPKKKLAGGEARVEQLELQKLAQNVEKQNRDYYAFYVDDESRKAQFENLEESKKSAPADDSVKESGVPKIANLSAAGRMFRRSAHHDWDTETEEEVPSLELGDTFGDDVNVDGFVGNDAFAFDGRLGITAKPQVVDGFVMEWKSVNGASQDWVRNREVPSSWEEFLGEGKPAARSNGTSDAIASGVGLSRGLGTDAESTGINSVSASFGVFDDGQLAGDLLPGAAGTRHDVNGDGDVAGKPSSSGNYNFSTLNRKAPQIIEEETDRLATSFHRIHKTLEFEDETLGTAGIVTEGLRSGDADSSNAGKPQNALVRRGLYLGEGAYDLGLYDKAEEHYHEVLKSDPYNKGARRGLERIAATKSDYYKAAYDESRERILMEVDQAWEDSGGGKFGNELQELENGRDRKRAEMLAQVDQAWERSLPNAFPESAPTPQGVATKLDDIILPELDLQNTSVEEAIARVTKLAAQNDRTGYGGVDLKLPSYDDSISEDFGSDPAESSPEIDQLYLKEVPLGVALQYIADKAKLRYKVDESGVTFLPLSSADGEDILTRSWTVPEGFGEFLTNSGGGDDPFPESRDGLSIQKQLQGQGINFPEISKASLIDGRLIVRNTSTQLDLVEQIVRASTKWDGGKGGESVGSAYMTSKLDQIIIPVVDFENTSVEEALDFLRIRSVELDAMTLDQESRGFNIVGHLPEGQRIDSLKMKNASFRQVLDKIAEKTLLDLQVDDFAVVLQAKPVEWAPKVGEDAVSKESVNALKLAIMPQVDFRKATIGNVTEYLNVTKKALGPEAAGIEFRFEHPEIAELQVDELNLKNLPLGEVLRYVADKSNSRYRIEGNEVIFYSDYVSNKEKLRKTFEISTAEKTDSTFSLNVSDVSFKLAKASLAQGKWPNADKVRSEEFVNALDYGDQKPTQAEKVACAIEQGAHPFMQQRNLMRVSLSTAALGRNASTPLRLTILLDQSGSMERHDRAESVRRAFDLLAAQLTPADEVTLVGFARTSRLLAERVKGSDCGKLSQIVAATPTEGGTNLENALGTGLRLAKQQFLKNAQNRIILLTDGAANLGDALPENLARQVEQMRHAGVSFDACGVGADGLNDEILSSLTKQGDGRYYFLDRPEDADAGFARQIAGALRPAARNVKVQIIFNPDRVSKFHLYGFEKHRLKKEDFRNDAVDAAEMAAEESGVALYHFETLPEGEGDVGMASIRFQDTATGKMVERTWRIPYEPQITAFDQSSPKLRLAGVAGLFGERLKQTPVGERVNLKELRREVDRLQPQFGNQLRFQELRQMLQQAGN